ncbi:MAG: ABC transporter substrate-binding protein [Nocardioidaceae bacterium]
MRAAVAVGLLAAFFVGPVMASGTSGASAADKVTFTVGLKNEVDSFNPFLGIEAPSYEMWALTYDMMVGYSMKDMSPVPDLATSWDKSADGLTWTFHIREGVTWSDDVPFTAADIAYTYNRILGGGTEADSWGSYLNNVTSVTAPDAKTVVLKLKKANATLPLLPIPIIPEHVWKNVSGKQVATYPNEPKDGQPVVGTGPFRMVEGSAGGSLYRFEANPDYWGGKPHVDEVVFRVFKAEDPMVQALIKGEVDFIHDISPIQVKALEKQKDITAIQGVSPYFEEIGFNTGAVDTKTGKPMGDGNPALQDPKFRSALGWAIDRDSLITKAYQGAAIAGDSIIPPTYSGWRWEPGDDERVGFDLDKAGQLLDEAGYKKGSDGLRTMPDGTPIGTLRLFARPEEKRSVTVMDFFQEWLEDLGIKAEVTAMESNRLTKVILDGDFDAFQWGWYVEPDPDSMLSYMTCDQRGAWSDSWYCNPEYDKLYKEQGAELDGNKRVEIVKQMQQILYRDAPYQVLAYTKDGQAFRNDKFGCFLPQPTPGGVLLMQYGGYNYTFLRPASEAGDCDGVAGAVGVAAKGETTSDGGGSNTGVIIGLGVVVVLVAAGGVVVGLRRRTTTADRE